MLLFRHIYPSLRETEDTAAPVSRRSTLGTYTAPVLLLGGALLGGEMYSQSQMRTEQERIMAQMTDDRGRIQALLSRIGTLEDRLTIDRLPEAVEQVVRSTVRIDGPVATGSGVLIEGNDGEILILTNAHVTRQNATKSKEFPDGSFKVTLYNGSDYDEPMIIDAIAFEVPGGQRSDAAVGGYDLALLRPVGRLPKDAHAASFADFTKDPVRVGDPAMVIGNPYGERDTVVSGAHLSHIARHFDLESESMFLQTTDVHPGNSGGGLFRVSMRGGKVRTELIGINTGAYHGTGVGFAIRGDVVQWVLQRHYDVPEMTGQEEKEYGKIMEKILEFNKKKE